MSLDEEWGEPSGLVGKKAGAYLIVRELANDPRRTLYEAENVELGVRVMLGVVRTDGKATEQRLKNGKKLQALEVPGLVKVLDVGKLESGELYVATERPEGTTLAALAGGKRFDPRRALLIIRQVLGALDAAHAAGTIHGDVKPANIVITPGLGDDRIKLTDFGVAALSGGTQAGDPAYSAPESALGQLDARSDIYSTGAVLSELLTGHPPFFAEDQNELRRLHAYAPRQPLEQRAPDLVCVDLLETVIATALEKKREDRYQSTADMIAALDPVLDAIEAAATPVPAATQERRRNPNDSIELFAQQLKPALDPSADAPLVPVNVTRQVPQLPWHMRAHKAARRVAEPAIAKLRPKLAALTKRQKSAIGGGAAALFVILLIVSIVTCGRTTKKPAPVAKPTDANAFLKRATDALAAGDEEGALSAYKGALALAPALADDPKVVGGLNRIATSSNADTRHRAIAAAESAGAKLDQVASWILDLDQATTCDERREAIGHLAAMPDSRSLPALRKAKAQKCVEKDANAAIQRITTAKPPHRR
jgi:hypothetical protein